MMQGDAGDLWLLLGAGGALVLGIGVFWAVTVITERRARRAPGPVDETDGQEID